jgi:hypothetical protein
VADQLASAADLAAWVQSDVDATSAALVLEAATAVVQAVTGQRLVRVADDVVTLDVPDAGGWLVLPQRPVVSVSQVLIGSTAVTDYTVSARSRLWRAGGWRSTLTASASQPSAVTVTYTHGYAADDQRLQLARAATLTLAAGAYSAPSGATQVRIDDYAESFEAMSTRLGAAPFLVEQLRRQYGRAVGSALLVAD